MVDFGTATGIIQVVQASIQLLAVACDFYGTRKVIHETGSGLQDELEVLLLMCNDIKRFLNSVGRQVSYPHNAPSSLQNTDLLEKALQNLNTEVSTFNQMVHEFRKHKSSLARTFSMMWNRTDWSGLNTRVSNHKLSILIAFGMLRIDQTQTDRLRTLVTFQKVTGDMKTLRKRHIAEADPSHYSRQKEAQACAHAGNNNDFYHQAESAYRKISDIVTPSVSRQQFAYDSDGSSMYVTGASPDGQTGRGGYQSDDLMVVSKSATQSSYGTTSQAVEVESFHSDHLLDKAALSAAAAQDRQQGDQILATIKREIQSDGRLSQDNVKQLEQARRYHEAALRRMSILESKFDVDLPIEDYVQVSNAAAKVHELCGRPHDAIHALLRLLSRELEVILVIGTQLEIVRLAFDAGRNEDAISLAHESYDMAKSRWVWRSDGIPEVVASLEMLMRVHQRDASLVGVYQKEAELFAAWNWIQNRHPDFAKSLREHEPSPLTYIAGKGYDSEVRELLRTNSRLVRYKNASGATPMIAAAHQKHIAVVKVLLENTSPDGEINVNEADNHGDTALHAAQMPPSIEFVQKHPNWADIANGITVLLLRHGAKAESRNILGQSVLHVAAEQGNCASMRTLLQKAPTEMKTQDRVGSTPLHVAIEKGRLEMVELLLTKGADATIEDDKGRSALQLARDPNLHNLRNNQIIELLRGERRKSRKVGEGISVSTRSSQSLYKRLPFWLKPQVL